VKAVKFLFNADLRGGHDNLKAQSKKVGVDLEKLETEEAAVFINRQRNKIKTYSYNGVMSYIRFTEESHRGIDMNALSEIARAFDKRGQLDYNKALKASLLQRLSKRSGDGPLTKNDVIE
jgi:hypothetical protein